MTDLLVQAGANVGVCNAAGMSPLLVAAAGGHADCLRMLLKLSGGDAAPVGVDDGVVHRTMSYACCVVLPLKLMRRRLLQRLTW